MIEKTDNFSSSKTVRVYLADAPDLARTDSKEGRVRFTNALKASGVRNGSEYAYCTDVIYQTLCGGTARQLKIKMALPVKANLRDHLSVLDRLLIGATEVMAAERIEAANCQGVEACRRETQAAAEAVKMATAFSNASHSDR